MGWQLVLGRPSESSEGEPLTSGDDVGATGSDSCALQSSANDDVVDTAENDENFRKETVELEHEVSVGTRDLRQVLAVGGPGYS